MRVMVPAVVALALISPARAATLATSFMFQAPGQRVHCDVVNVGSSAVTVKVELIGTAGTVVTSGSTSLQPGHGVGRIADCNGASGTPPGCAAYCRFTAPRRNQIRGVLTVTPADSQSPIVSLPAQ
jgi:hypothetical protein